MSDATTNQISAALETVAPEQTQTIEAQLASLKLAITLLTASHQEVSGRLAEAQERITSLENRPAGVVYLPTPPVPSAPTNILPSVPLQPTITLSKAPVVESTAKTVPAANPLQSLQRNL
jgi:hypothetical protein